MIPIPLIASAEIEHLSDNHRIEHLNAHFLATRKYDSLFAHSESMKLTEISFFGYNDRIPNSMKSGTIVHIARPVEILHPQHQHCLNRTAEECGIIIRRRYSKGEDNNSRHNGYEKSSDDDCIFGSFVGPIYYYNNSMPAKLENLDLAIQPELFFVEETAQNNRDYSCSGSDDSSLQQMFVIAPRSYGRRDKLQLLTFYFLRLVLIFPSFEWSLSGSKRRCYSKHDYRRGSGNIQHPSNIKHIESDDDSPSPTNYRIAVRSRQKISNLLRDRESIDPSCMPSIVAAIDSGRESDIIRKNSPKRTSSRDKKMRNKGFDVVIRTQNNGESFENRRRTLSASSSSHDKPIEAYLVTEF
ncbi:hypothetical protein LOAG_16551 [Loa loa]|uniref:Uncharacterized protein n=1 Tax=Loa loa TaxID=7209 RepID=A0A1S0UMD6_LOALO|nr:hypothetical protein LOAG_16551 [Loa loa]EJD76538.1 hypothetical protein LOAG_16551 [Loa loa]